MPHRSEMLFFPFAHLVKTSATLLSPKTHQSFQKLERKRPIDFSWLEMHFCLWLAFHQIQQRKRQCFSLRRVLPCNNQTKDTNFTALFIGPDFQQSLRYELCRGCTANEFSSGGFSHWAATVPSAPLPRASQTTPALIVAGILSLLLFFKPKFYHLVVNSHLSSHLCTVGMTERLHCLHYLWMVSFQGISIKIRF